MKILTISGNHPRHLYYINTLASAFNLSGAIVECRENIIPQPPAEIGEQDRQNFIRHFANRERAENKYFGEQPLPNCPLLNINREELNSAKTVDFVRTTQPDIVMIFGSKMIKDPLFSALPEQKVNLHLGLSPRYRGAATLFWPFYYLEPNYAGSTFHYIVAEPDAGDVIHQVVPPLEPGDTIHDIGCKTIVASAQEAVELLSIYKRQGHWRLWQQKGTGKKFLESDFKPEHLRVIYDLFDDNLIDAYLSNQIRPKEPVLLRQF